MKRIVMIGAAILVVLVGIAAMVPFLVPDQVYRDQIEKTASAALGREVALTGEVDISLLPRLAARFDGVTVENPEGFSRENMIEAGELRAAVRWMPLLSRKVEVAELVFADADVALERLADGRANWEFASASAPQPETGGGEAGGGFDAGIDRASLRNARLTYRDAGSGADYTLSQLNMTASVRALDTPLKLSADGRFQDEAFDLSVDLDTPKALMDGRSAAARLVLASGPAELSYEGGVQLADVPGVDGAFRLDARDLTSLAALAGLELDYNLAALGQVRANGQVSGPVEALSLRFDEARVDAQELDLNYQGDFSLAGTPALNGRLDVNAGNLGAFLTALGVAVPGQEAFGKLDFSGEVAGPVDALAISKIALTQSSGLMTSRFDGDVGLGGVGKVAGRLEAASPRLRDLLAAFDVELPPGDTLETFSLSGNAAGSFQALAFTGLEVALDAITASGQAGLNLSGPRPMVTANVTAGALDLSPFLGESEPADSFEWSDAPLDLEGLKAVDADLTIKADRIILGEVTLDRADLSAVLKAGKLDTNLRSVRTLGGDWNGRFALDASGQQPGMTLKMSGLPIQISETLGTLAGLDAISGVGQVAVDVRSTGGSLKALVSGLTGDMSLDLADGMVRGINVGQLVRSRENIVKSLADGSLQLALSPQAATDFTEMVAALRLDNGVAQLRTFKLSNPVLSLDGSGSIDLGARTLDIGIVPRLDTAGAGQGSAVQLNGVPIPFRIRGNWMSPSLAPDTQLVQKLLRDDLTRRARDELTDQIGDDVVGGLLGDVLGKPKPAPAAPPASDADDPSASETAQPDAEEPAAPEDQLRDAAEDAARDALGGLFGKRGKAEDDGADE